MADLYLTPGESVARVTFGGNVFGSTGTETVTYTSDVAGRVIDQNVEQVSLIGTTASYTFQQAGNQLLIFSAGTQVARITLQNDANGTLISFANGTVEAKASSLGLTLGGTIVSPAAPSPVVPVVIDGPGGSGDQTFTLTEGTDTIQGNAGNLVGSNGTVNIAGDDLIIAGTSVAGGIASNNLGAGDVIDGGAGDDTLRIIDDRVGAETFTPAISNVETVEVQSLGGGVSVNLINAEGVDQLTNYRSTSSVAFENVLEEAVVAVVGSGTQDEFSSTFVEFEENAITDESVSISMSDSRGFVAIDVSGEDVTTLAVESIGGESELDFDNLSDANRLFVSVEDNGASLETLSISGDTATFVSDVFDDFDDLTAVNVTNTGDTWVDLRGNSAAVAITSGEGDDTFQLDSDELTVADSANGGAGTDNLWLEFDSSVDLVDTKAGTPGFQVGDAGVLSAVNNATNFEELTISVDDNVINLDPSAFTTIDTFNFVSTGNDFDAAINVEGVADEDLFRIWGDVFAGATFEAANNQDVLNVELADAAPFELAPGFNSVNSLTATDFSTVNLDVNNEGEFTQVSALNVSDDTEVLVTGEAEAISIDIGTGLDVTLDASALETDGNVVLARGAATGTVVSDLADANFLIGGAGNDTLVGTDQDDVINGDTGSVPVTPAPTNPALTNTYTPGQTFVPGDATTQELTFNLAAGSFGIDDVIEYTFDDGGAGAPATVKYTVDADDVATADPVQIAANVAAGFLAAYNAAAGVTDSTTATRNIANVITIVSDVVGQTALNSNVTGTETAGGALPAASVTDAVVNQGTDNVPAAAETLSFNDFTATKAGDLVVTVDGVTATFENLAAGDTVTGIEIANELQAASDPANVIENGEALGNNVVGFTTDDATAPVTTYTFAGDPLLTLTNGVDRLTGNGGEDIFVVASTGVATAAVADVITDFNAAVDVIDFANLTTAGTAGNYVEGPVGGQGNYNGALAQANNDFIDRPGSVYSAQQVGADVFIFGEFTGDFQADQVVQLLNTTLADLPNNGSFIIA